MSYIYPLVMIHTVGLSLTTCSAQYFLSSDLLAQYIHAARPIEKDEEITISYAAPLALHSNRQEYFESTFQFICTCQRCSPGSHNKQRTIQDSDKATQEIVNLRWQLSQPNPAAGIREAERLIKLYKDEGLDGFLDTAYGYTALAFNRAGRAGSAKKYAKLAAEASWLQRGFDGAEKTQEWEGFAKDPTGHASWKNRRREL
jgi:hypothetical protein